MLFIFASLLVGYVSSTSENCAYFLTGIPLDDCYYVDASYIYSTDSSGGYFCGDDNGTESTVTFQEYETATCSGTEGYSWDYSCSSATDALFYCNCGGSADDCSTVTLTTYDCDDTTDGTYYALTLIIDLCYEVTSTTSASYNCNGGTLGYSSYDSTDCTGDNNAVTAAPTTYSCDARSDCEDWCYSYATISCTAGAKSITLFGAVIIALFSMIF